MFRSRAVVVSLLVGLALVASACTNTGGDLSTVSTTDASDTTATSLATTTTEVPLTTLPPDSIPGTNSDSISPEIAADMREEIGALMLDAEENRGLPFISVPTVTILDATDFSARVRTALEHDLDPEELAAREALFKLLGLLDDDVDLQSTLVELYTEQVAGFYDPDAGELVVPVSVDGITPLQKIVIIHELTHALTDQHYDFNDEYERRLDEGNGDDATSLLALVEGDATYQQFLYLESLSPAEATSAAIEALSIDSSLLDLAPQWMQRELAFPYENGLRFVGEIVATGGLKGVDEAYQDLPISSEQILDPNKYQRSEQPDDMAALAASLNGWSLDDEATFGEWGIRLLLSETLLPGVTTQAAAGWGNDSYRLFTRGDDAAFVWQYLGETEQDAEDLVDGLIVHIRKTMDAGPSQESGGGLLFDSTDPYVFIDRVDQSIFFIVATDPGAGADLREQLGL